MIPGPQVLHQFAREVVRSHARDIGRMSVGEMMADDRRFIGLTEEELDEVVEAIYQYARTYAKAISWPVEFVADDEQRQQVFLPDLREVTQRFLADDPTGVPGDCVRAAVAALLDREPTSVPHFIAGSDIDNRVWWYALKGWAAENGWTVTRRGLMPRQQDVPLPEFGIACGPSPRGASHAVVVRGGEMVWDPHPSRDGILRVKEVVEFTRIETETLEQVRDRLRTRLPELKAYLADRFSPAQPGAVEETTCAHCQRDLTGASIHTIQGIDVCADIRHCLGRQARFAERIADLNQREAQHAAAQGERDGGVRAVDAAIKAITLFWSGDASGDVLIEARAQLIERYGSQIAALNAAAPDAKDGE